MGNSTQPFEIYGALDPVGSPKYKRIHDMLRMGAWIYIPVAGFCDMSIV